MCVLSRALLVLALLASAFFVSNGFTVASQADVDKAIHSSLRDVINHGADLFNESADHAGCYRAYEGGLLAVKPLLRHRPELQKAIDDGLAEAAKQTRVVDRAFALRKVIDSIREKLKVPDPVPTPMIEVTLWEQLQGSKRLPGVVDSFVTDVAADPRIDLDRDGKMKIDIAKVKAAVLAYIGKKAGAPMASNAKSLKDALDAEHLQDFEFNLAVSTLKEKLKAAGISDADAVTLLKSIDVTHRPVTVIPVPPTPRVEVKPEIKPEVKTPVKPVEPKPEVRPPVKPIEPKPEVKAPPKPVEPKPEVRPPVKPIEPKPEVKAPPKPVEPKPEVKPQPKPPVRPVEPKPEVKPPIKPIEVKPEVKPPVKPDPKKIKPQPQPESIPAPKKVDTSLDPKKAEASEPPGLSRQADRRASLSVSDRIMPRRLLPDLLARAIR